MFYRLRTRIAVVFSAIVILAVLAASFLIVSQAKPSDPGSILIGVLAPVVAVSLIAIIVASFSIGSRVSTSVQRIIESSRKLVMGTPSAPVRVTGRDEMAELTGEYNNLVASLKHKWSGIYSKEDFISAIINAASDGIIVVDSASKVILINDSALTIFRTTREQASGHPFIEVTIDHELQEMVNQCLSNRQQKSTVVQLAVGKKSLGVSTRLMPDNSSCLMLLEDISELQRSRTTRRDFLTNISHELRTPVTSIRILAETLSAGAVKDASKSAEYLKKIEVEADRLGQLISEMSEMLAIEGGYTPVKKSGLAASELLKETSARLGPQATHSGLTLIIDVADNLPLIDADQDKLEHVLANLVQNSIKFTPSGGRITLSAKAVPGALQFSVTDTGIGISEEDLPRVFERFYKVDRARSKAGTGLGLAIAKHIVEAHGGRIWAESIEGKGSTFYFTVPLRQA